MLHKAKQQKPNKNIFTSTRNFVKTPIFPLHGKILVPLPLPKGRATYKQVATTNGTIVQ